MVSPQTNRALRFNRIGGDLFVDEEEIPPPPSNELLVKVHAASVNPVDIQLWRSGLVGVVAGNKGMGRDFSGTVVAVGSDVKGWKEGEDIFGLLFHVFGQGTFSQYINVNPASDPVAKKPTSLTHEQASSIPLVAMTAFSCLEWLPQLLPSSTSSRKVAIRGASGGTGMWLVQLAKVVYDCHVTAICSTRNAEFVRELGADQVIDYTKEDVASALGSQRTLTKQDYDLIVDCVGGTDLLSTYPQIVNPKGAYVTIVGDKTNVKTIGGPITYFTSPGQIWRYIHGWIWGPRYGCIALYMKTAYVEQVARLADRGEVKVEIQEVIEGAFDEREGWRKAIKLMEEGRVRGKVVLAIP
ncbi:hypothetical protein HYFRA_00011063 [Hymenoscyphus fraxineus]|uniref:Enoyl reductase (ER) domain-containing protein n=1 Tax=Hymenoscyphus fraxineus TaxID=746836 RepID=A0A9N9PSS9_9HELO|nr:hypothetical protein HYFRA_00011063 [Hymenoscyphus fraxineus]